MIIRSLVGNAAHACGPETTLEEAATEMVRHDVGSLAVIDGSNLIGIITERDVLRAVAKDANIEGDTVSSWMTPDPDTVSANLDIDDAVDWLLATGYRHLPVVEDGTLLGVASIKDLLWAISSDRRDVED
jgi:CBS domain-containing protein